jgi:hypothetical protein
MKNINIIPILTLLLLFSCNNLESEQYIKDNLKNISSGIPKDKISRQNLGHMIITYPEAASKKLPLIMIFGGIDYATPEFMMKNTPQIYFENAILVFAPCKMVGGLGFKFYKKQLDLFIAKKQLEFKNFSVCGFSGGGPDAMSAEGEDINVLGLIDASPELPSQKPSFKKIINEFNVENWHDNSPDYKQTMEKKFRDFAEWTRVSGGEAVDNSLDHKLFPKYFLYRYRNILLY